MLIRQARCSPADQDAVCGTIDLDKICNAGVFGRRRVNGKSVGSFAKLDLVVLEGEMEPGVLVRIEQGPNGRKNER